MSLRARVALTVATTVALLIVMVGAVLPLLSAREVGRAVDRDLTALVGQVQRDPRGALAGPRRDRFGAGGIVQLVTEDGRAVTRADRQRDHMLGQDTVVLPVDERVLAVAAGAAPAFLTTVEVEGRELRVLTAPLREGLAIQVARPLDERGVVVRAIRRRAIVVTVLAVVGAAVAAWWAAGRSTRAVTALADQVGRLRGDDDLSERLSVEGDLEVQQLAGAFNELLVRLASAREARSRFTADASHELRTPLTSLRTNLEVLALDAEHDRLAPDERARLASDVLVQLDELTVMVDGLVAMARLDAGPTTMVEVVPSALVEEVVAAARRRHPQRATDLRLDVAGAVGLVHVLADRDRLALAVAELIDNAVKHAPTGAIDVTVDALAAPDDASGTVEVRVRVRDHGPAVDAEELPRLFERFHRAEAARATPGSGLGLALVAAVAQAHGGRAMARLADGGGLEVELAVPAHRH